MKNFIFEITYGNGTYEDQEGWGKFVEYYSHKIMFTDMKDFLLAANKFSEIVEVVDQFQVGEKTPMEAFNAIMEELRTFEDSWEKRQYEGKCEWCFRWPPKSNCSDTRFVTFTIRRNSDMKDILDLGFWIGERTKRNSGSSE